MQYGLKKADCVVGLVCLESLIVSHQLKSFHSFVSRNHSLTLVLKIE